MNTPRDKPKVIFGSVVGTTLKYKCGSPVMYCANNGKRSTGIISMVFIKVIQINIVNANGPTNGFLTVIMSLTFLLTNSTVISTRFAKPEGAPLSIFLATR